MILFDGESVCGVIYLPFWKLLQAMYYVENYLNRK